MRCFAWLLCVVVTVFVASCGKGGVEVSDTNFKDQIETQQNLVFKFNEKLVPDSLTGEWDSTEFVKFTPAVPGKFRWSSPNELVFSPSTQFTPSTDYKAEVTKEVLRYSTEKGLGERKSFALHTPYLQLTGAESFWTKVQERSGAIEARVTAKFNYPVQTQKAASLMKVFVNDRLVNFIALNSAVSRDVELALREISSDFDDAKVRIVVEKGLAPEESEVATREQLSVTAQLPSRKDMEVVEAFADFAGAVGSIKIMTSQSLEDGQDIHGKVKLEPSVNFTCEKADFGFLIKGDFKQESAYKVTIAPGLRGVLGGVMSDEFEKQFSFGSLEPSIMFSDEKAMYLTSKGTRNVGIKVAGVARIKVTIVKIFESNLHGFVWSNSGYYDDDGDYIADYSYLSEGGMKAWGNILSEREYDVKSLAKAGNLSLLNLDINDISDRKGAYIVKVESTEDQWIAQGKLIAISDIGLIAKATDNDVYVFANSILTAEPIKGASVRFLSTNNQLLHETTTDQNGVAQFNGIRQKTPDFTVGMITATYNNADFTYMMLRHTKVESSRFDVGGLEENSSGLQAFMYGDRNIYRPGETIHLNTIVRDAKWNSPGTIPIKIKVLNPQGREFRTFKQTLNNEGAFALDIPMGKAAMTGTYHVECYTANDVLLSEKGIGVEEFFPDRIRVLLSLDKTQYTLNDSIKAIIQASNYFGPPAANRNFEVNFALRRESFSSKQYRDYNFSLTSDNYNSYEQVVRQGRTDQNGKATETFSLPKELANTGMLTVKCFATVFDEAGRPVSKMQETTIPTQDVFFGLKQVGSYLNVRENYTFPLACVDKQGSNSTGNATVRVIRKKWQTVLEKSGDNTFRYVSEKKDIPVMEKNVSISGTSSFSFTPQESGEYEVRVFKQGATVFVGETFYAYGYGWTDGSAFQVNKEGTIDIELDKPTYTVGDRAKVLFKTPFPGKLLVSVERAGVMSYQYLNTDNKSASMELPVTEDFVPNVYISATLFKPIDDGAMPLTVAHGFQPLIVENNNSRIQLAINAPTSIRSNSKQTISVKAQNNSNVQMTIAVVDEGILALRNMKTPDPHGYFFQKRALQVRSHDMYPYIFPNIKPGKFAYGSGDDELESRVTPVMGKRVNLVAFWSGIISTNASGEGTFTIDIPQFSGSLRVMAVAYKGKSFGSAEQNMTVADPIVISSGLPRFLSPGDTALVPVTLTNSTTAASSCSASIGVRGYATVLGNTSQTVSIPANSEQRVLFKVVAQNAIGLANIDIKAQSGGETFTESTELPVRPISPLLKTTGNGTVAAGETKSFQLMHNYLPQTTKAKLIVSRSPVVEFAKSLVDLIDYPYGCVEQTTSSAFPQLYVGDLAKQLHGQNLGVQASNNVQEAIRKLESMQLYNGALSYWQGGIEESWWGSIYACHFLLEAQKAGYEVRQQTIDNLLLYISKKVHFKDLRTYWYFDAAGKTYSRQIVPQEVFYSLYVLALGGKKDVALMNFHKTSTANLSHDSRYLLALSYLLLGDKASYESLLPKQITEFSQPATGGAFQSWIRDEALVLSVMVDIDPNNPQVLSMTRHLSSQLKQQRRLYTTQENAFALLALGKVARKNTSINASATITVNGKQVATLTSSDVVLTENMAGATINVTSKNGPVYFFWEVSGVSTSNSIKEEDSFVKIRRTFLDRFGKPIASNTFRQNDLIVVKLSINSLNNSVVENVAMVDMLPAGFEIENPRIRESTDMSWLKSPSTPQFIDIRDDRIIFFADISGKEQNYYYVARAVSTGTFRIGPAAADAMYFSDFHSYNGSGWIKVVN